MGLLPAEVDNRLLVGLETRDDAGVYQISEELALVQTVDFFTPVVDDPYDYGQIAVANSLSDIYAMGAKPLTALNIVGFPIGTLDKKILAKILLGGVEKSREAGVSIVGGHSVKDPEIKYGLAVTALIHPAKIIRNNTAQIGDLLILTKPIGTGILTTALKNETLPDALLAAITDSMKRLNKNASEIMIRYGATACTDVTGFGLLGHLVEMMGTGQKSAKIYTADVPLFSQVFSFIEKKNIPGGLKENRKFLEPILHIPPNFDERFLNLLCDPQTSGGLLFSLPAERAGDCLEELRHSGETKAAIIGEVVEWANKPVLLI
ncbi:MAG: selenide, water dikinase SelD [Calditrichia bacterium]